MPFFVCPVSELRFPSRNVFDVLLRHEVIVVRSPHAHAYQSVAVLSPTWIIAVRCNIDLPFF